MPGRAVLPPLLAALLCACSGDAPVTEGGITVRDSAGVRIVENGPVDLARPGWRLADGPEFRVGWLPGEREFGGIVWGILLPDGGAVVGDRSPSRVVRISPSGEVVREFGREGEGPGEIGSFGGGTYLGGDTVLIRDRRNLRFSAFHRGTFVSEIGLTGRMSRASPLWRLAERGVTPEGDILLADAPRDAPRFDDAWGRAPIVVMSRDGARWDTIATYDARPPESLEWGTYEPFGSVDVSGDRIVVGRSDRPEVRWLSTDGRLLQIARWEAELGQVSNQYRTDFRRYMIRERPDYPADRLESVVQQAWGPFPHFTVVMGDAAASAWLGDYTTQYADTRQYRVLSSDGVWVGVVQVPRTFDILDVGEDRMLVAEHNAFDIEAVAVYRLEKDGPGR